MNHAAAVKSDLFLDTYDAEKEGGRVLKAKALPTRHFNLEVDARPAESAAQNCKIPNSSQQRNKNFPQKHKNRVTALCDVLKNMSELLQKENLQSADIFASDAYPA